MEEKTPSHILSVGDVLARQRILAHLGATDLGEHYTACYGTTSHVTDLFVAAASAEPLYRGILARSRDVPPHPCLVRYHACGTADGHAWLRAEHSCGVPPEAFTTAVVPATLPYEESCGGPAVRTLADLTAVAVGPVADVDLAWLFGDLFEAALVLERAGLAISDVRPEAIVFDTCRQTGAATARVRFYGLPVDGLSAWQAEADCLAALVKTIATGDSPLARALSALADRLSALPSAAAAYEEYDKTLVPFSLFHSLHVDAEAADPTVTVAHASVATDRLDADEEDRPHRAGPPTGSAEAIAYVKSLFQLLGLIVLLAGVGVGVYFYLQWSERKARVDLSSDFMRSFSSVRTIPLSDEDAILSRITAESLPTDVLLCTPEQIRVGVERGNPLAVARSVVDSFLETGEDVSREDVDRARGRLAPVIVALERASRTNPSAAFLHGYAVLLGLCADRTRHLTAVEILRTAANDCPQATLLLGDWAASQAPFPNAPGSRILRDGMALSFYQSAAGFHGAPDDIRLAAVLRGLGLLQKGRGLGAGRDKEVLQWVRDLAFADFVPAVVLLEEPSVAEVFSDPFFTMSCLRRLKDLPTLHPDARAWVLRTLARHFAAGDGVPRDAAAARIWMQRAAELGDGAAMEAFAGMLESGEGAKSGEPDAEEARRWRARAAEASSAPDWFASRPYPVALAVVEADDEATGASAPAPALDDFFREDDARPTRSSTHANRAATLAPRVRRTARPADDGAPKPLTP